MWFLRIPEKWVAGLGPHLDKTPWTLEGSPRPYKQETRGLGTIQATSLLSRKCFGKRRFVKKKMFKAGKIVRNHRPVWLFTLKETISPQSEQTFNRAWNWCTVSECNNNNLCIGYGYMTLSCSVTKASTYSCGIIISHWAQLFLPPWFS